MKQLEPQSIASLFGISVEQLAFVIGLDPNTLATRSKKRYVQKKLALLVHAWDAIAVAFVSDDAIRRWLRHPNRRLNGQTPLELLEASGLRSFAALAGEIEGGTYA